MEILTHGKYFKDDTYKCYNCGCVFRYKPKDIQIIHFTNGNIARILLICPECREKNYLG